MAIRLVGEDSDLSLGIYEVSGEVNLERVFEFRKETTKGRVNRNVILDFSSADVSTVDANSMKELIAHGVQALAHRRGGMTILVSDNEINRLSIRLYCELASLNPDLPVSLHLVRDMEEAYAMLEERSAPPSG
ncbi:MAG: hypothetical protein RJQ21_10715 [Rhodospirillales bacterium]